MSGAVFIPSQSLPQALAPAESQGLYLTFLQHAGQHAQQIARIAQTARQYSDLRCEFVYQTRQNVR